MVVFTLGVLWTLTSSPRTRPPDPAIAADNQSWFPWFLGVLPAVFAATGIGNGSTYRMIPAILRRRGRARPPPPARRSAPPRCRGDQAGVGRARRHRRGRRARRLPDPVAVQLAVVDDPLSATKGAFVVFTCFYVVCALVTWRSTCASRRGPRDQPGAWRGRSDDPTTHCPYCALQCGMTLERAASRAGGRGLAGLPGQRGRPVPEGLDRGRAARPPRAADHAAGARPRDRRAAGGRLGRGARPRRRPAPRAPARARPRRGRRLRRRRADQREGLPARQVRPGRAAAPARSTTTAASACRRRPRPRNRAFGIDRGLPFPLADLERDRRRWCWSARTSPRPCRRSCGTSTGCASTAARSSSIDPRRTADRRARRPAPAAGARHRPGARPRAAAPARSPRAPSTRTTSPRAPPASTTVRALGRRRSGPSGSSGSPACRSRELRDARRAAGRRRPGHDAHRARRRAARQGHRHRARLDQPGARARAARPAGRRLRLPDRPGQRPGRARARPEGRPAARLPHDRRPGRPRARRRGLGRRRRRRCPARAARRTSCSTRSAPPAGPGAAGVRLQPRGLRAATPRTSPSGSPRSTCWWSATSCCRRPPRWPTSCCRSRSGPRRPAP